MKIHFKVLLLAGIMQLFFLFSVDFLLAESNKKEEKKGSNIQIITMLKKVYKDIFLKMKVKYQTIKKNNRNSANNQSSDNFFSRTFTFIKKKFNKEETESFESLEDIDIDFSNNDISQHICKSKHDLWKHNKNGKIKFKVKHKNVKLGNLKCDMGYVYTRKGTRIKVYKTDRKGWNYNCLSLALGLANDKEQYWLMESDPKKVMKILKENKYKQVKDPKPGDLVIYKKRDNDSFIEHVAEVCEVTSENDIYVYTIWSTARKPRRARVLEAGPAFNQNLANREGGVKIEYWGKE